jgi:hypothetical protein
MRSLRIRTMNSRSTPARLASLTPCWAWRRWRSWSYPDNRQQHTNVEKSQALHRRIMKIGALQATPPSPTLASSTRGQVLPLPGECVVP